MKYIVTLNGKKYEVDVEKGQATAMYVGPAEPVSVPAPVSAPVPAEVSAPATTVPAPAPVSGAAKGDGEAVASPMPGNIMHVRVQAGQSVKSGDILFILEAMKMENEIMAPRDGVVTAVNVAKGATVDTGSVLCTLK
ncbi:MAG: biotin/lipoyl-binding protein [Firmicutes bacterium]|nr:biotin/lipoyl-binding protein [Bacillota bacterium]